MNVVVSGQSLPAARRQFETAWDSMFDSFFQDFFSNKDTVLNRLKGSGKFYPKLDVLTEGDRHLIRAAMPGVKAEDVKVEVVDSAGGSVVRIAGRMAEEYKSSDKADHHVRELHKSSFEREVPLPDYISGDPIASYKDGILTLIWTVKKPEENVPNRRLIKVNVE